MACPTDRASNGSQFSGWDRLRAATLTGQTRPPPVGFGWGAAGAPDRLPTSWRPPSSWTTPETRTGSMRRPTSCSSTTCSTRSPTAAPGGCNGGVGLGDHWKHLRTTSVVESPFAAVRLRTTAAKRFKRVESATALIWKLLFGGREAVSEGSTLLTSSRTCLKEGSSKTESPSQPNSGRMPPDTFTHLLTQPLATRAQCLENAPSSPPSYASMKVSPWLTATATAVLAGYSGDDGGRPVEPSSRYPQVAGTYSGPVIITVPHSRRAAVLCTADHRRIGAASGSGRSPVR